MNTNEFYDWLLGYLDASGSIVDTEELREKMKQVTKVYAPAQYTNLQYYYPKPYYISNTYDTASYTTGSILGNKITLDKTQWDDVTVSS